MHQVAHLVPQAAAGIPAAQASSNRAKSVDEGAFGASLRSSIEATAVPSAKVPAQSAQPVQIKPDSLSKQAAAEERTTLLESSNSGAPSSAAKPDQSQETDQATPGAAVKKPSAKPATPQKEASKATKDAAAQDTDATQVQSGATPVKETVQPLQVATVPVVTVPVDSSNPSVQKVQTDALKTEASSAAAATGRPVKPEIKKVDTASTAVAAATPGSATPVAAAAPVTAARSVDAVGSASTGTIAVAVHASAQAASPTTVEPKSAHAPAIAPAVVQAESSDVQTLVATPKVLEIGVASDSHGWLRVRAEVDGTGDISAAVVATSAGAAEGLHRELPAISAYLAGEQVGVSSLVVHAAGGVATTQDAMSGSAFGAAGSGTQKDSNQTTGNSLPQLSGDSQEGMGLEDASAMLSMPSAVFSNGTGSWLSVRV